MKKKLLYTGMAAAMLLTGFPSTAVGTAIPTTDFKKDIEEIRNENHSSQVTSKFNNLDVSKIMKIPNRNGFKKLASENDYIIETEPNDFPSLANPLGLGIGAVGDFSYDVYGNGDLDFYRIKVPESGYLWLGIIMEYSDYQTDLGFGLFNSNEEIVKPVDYGTSGEVDYRVLPVEPGTYYIAATNLADIASYDNYILLANMLDLTPPAAPKVNPIDDNDKTINGKAEATSTVTIKNGSKIFKTVKASTDGKFKLTLAKPFKAGTKLSFIAEDSSGNTSKATVVKVADQTAPPLTVNKVYTSSKYISGKTEAKVSVAVKIGSKTIGSGKSDAKGFYKLKIKPQKKNTKLTVVAKDSYGNAKTVIAKVK